LGTGIVALIVNAFIGAVVLLLIAPRQRLARWTEVGPKVVARIMGASSRYQLTLSASALEIITGPKKGSRILRRP
jgi:hypothetical protein